MASCFRVPPVIDDRYRRQVHGRGTEQYLQRLRWVPDVMVRLMTTPLSSVKCI